MVDQVVKFFLIFFTAATLISCSSYRPIFDENERYISVGEEKAESDFKICKKRGDEFLDKYKAERAAKEAGRKAVIGGVVGALSGAIWGKNMKSTLIGSAIGAGAGAALGGLSVLGEDKIKPDEMKQKYIVNCLASKGYSVAGWR
jgi:hypothetical protein